MKGILGFSTLLAFILAMSSLAREPNRKIASFSSPRLKQLVPHDRFGNLPAPTAQDPRGPRLVPQGAVPANVKLFDQKYYPEESYFFRHINVMEYPLKPF